MHMLRRPIGLSSSSKLSDIPRTACFEPAYRPIPSQPLRERDQNYVLEKDSERAYFQPAMEPRNMMNPDFLSLIWGRNARVTFKGPKTLVLYFSFSFMNIAKHAWGLRTWIDWMSLPVWFNRQQQYVLTENGNSRVFLERAKGSVAYIHIRLTTDRDRSITYQHY